MLMKILEIILKNGLKAIIIAVVVQCYYTRITEASILES